MRHRLEAYRAQYGELLSSRFCLCEHRRASHQAQDSRFCRDPGFEVTGKFGFFLRLSCGVLQIGAYEHFEIVARWRIGWKSVYELIERCELIRVLHMCALMEGNRLEHRREGIKRIDLFGSG